MLAILAESALRSFILGSVVWIGLNLLRVRNPHVHMMAWAMVLVASLSMPLLMHWMTLTITLEPSAVPAPERLWPSEIPLPEPLSSSIPSELHIPGTALGGKEAAVNCWGIAVAIYSLVSAVLLLRLVLGVWLTWRLVRMAKPITESWLAREPWLTSESCAANSNVRVSNAIGGPVTFGSTILLPPQCVEWDLRKRRAVLAHEGAHVANMDFYVLLLASLNRAVFWFSPFAWWQLVRLAELAEIISDAHALEVLDDRLSYAEMLLDLMGGVRGVSAGLEMARPCTIRARIERIISATVAPAKVGWRKRFCVAAVVLPVVVVSAGTVGYNTGPASAIDTAEEATAANSNLQRVSFYSVNQTSIFAIFWQGDGLFGQLTEQRKLRLSPDGDGRYIYPAAGGPMAIAVGAERHQVELKLSRNGHDSLAALVAEVSGQPPNSGVSLASYVGWYELTPFRVLAVTSDGDRLYVQETGQPKVRVAPRGVDAFGRDNDLVIFLRDDQAGVSRVLLQATVPGARIASRIDAAKATMIEERFARRVSEVPDRFRQQAPVPGGKEEVLHAIADLQSSEPTFERMTAALISKIRRQAPELKSAFKTLGSVKSIFFRGVGSGGYDVYGVKFTKGTAEFRVLLDVGGKIDDMFFRAEGNERVGGIMTCSAEAQLRSPADTAPIHVVFYNVTDTNIQLYRLDSEGRRTIQGVLGENMSSSVLTSVDTPWVVADASGACLEIVLPGQRTRFNTIEETRPDGLSDRAASRRTEPLAGSEEMLRQYIEALRRGETNYDRMTSEVAEQTRQQLAFNQAIMSRLGELRALSFRGVTGMGNDTYMAHFANGSAEWRIGLAKDGSIGRIALGPQ